MRRYGQPYNGKQYLYNKNTGEIHNLDNEYDSCQINEIKAEHISMFDSYEEAVIYCALTRRDIDGCAHCFSEKHTD